MPDPARPFRVALCAATLAMIGLSPRLWLDRDDFPTVPFVLGWPAGRATPVALGLALVGLAIGMTRFGRAGVGLAAAAIGCLVVGDQLRLQPWAGQFVVFGALMAIARPAVALRLGRIYAASVYLHSGLSKLDAPFLAEIGPRFARTLAGLLGVGGYVVADGPGAILAMPVVEIVVAALLVVPRTRRVGLVGAVLIHAALLAILGPAGLGQSTIVLAWNLALIAEGWFLYWPDLPAATPSDRSRYLALTLAFLVAMPLTERLGWFDSWPSHALYASHCERSRIGIEGRALPALPDTLRVAAVRSGATGEWSLAPTDWSRAALGVPAYPSTRYLNGLAEWVARRAGGAGVRVEHESRAGLRGGRTRLVLEGLGAIRDEGGRFWFNAHPGGL